MTKPRHSYINRNDKMVLSAKDVLRIREAKKELGDETEAFESFMYCMKCECLRNTEHLATGLISNKGR